VILVRVAQAALCGLAHTAEHIDRRVKDAFRQVGLPTPGQTRGQDFANTMRGYAARLDGHPRPGSSK
jgi:hypothetical protein